jgi:G:T-mismatch repair DNA endonuclease (very short patch repair protein)
VERGSCEEDPTYRKKMKRALKRQWTPEKREAKSKEMKRKWKDPEYKAKMSEQSQKLWEDPEHQERMKPIVARWTKPEKVVRGWLKKMGLYKTGHDGGVGFLPHRWLPTRGAGFSANGDFVDYNHKLIIHVDGDYWHSRPEVVEQDRRLDAWCDANGWAHMRLTESGIYKHPIRFQKAIRSFVLSHC